MEGSRMRSALKRLLAQGVTFAKEIALLVLIVTLLQTGLVHAYHVPTGSMESTILPGDMVLADKFTLGPRTPQWIGIPFTDIGAPVPAIKFPGLRDPKPGDIVVVEVPIDERTPYVKRVVATGGQTVEVRGKRLYVDGRPARTPEGLIHGDSLTLPRGLKQPGIYRGAGNRDNWGPYTVPEGHVFLMGDNRDFSLDSRYFGAVPEENIVGLARVVHASFKQTGGVLLDRIRWDRFGTALR